MTDNNEENQHGSWDDHVAEWRARLKMSAASLAKTSLKLKEIIDDERRFALLTDLTSFHKETRTPGITEETIAEIDEETQEFSRVLEEALTSLVDLYSYNNPEREYPNLKSGYEFNCSNLGIGKIVDIFYIKDEKITKGTPDS